MNQVAASVAWTLRAARTSTGLTQETLAERLGVSRTTVQRVERGRVYPRPDLILSWERLTARGAA